MLFNTENLYFTHSYMTLPATGQLAEVGVVDHRPIKKRTGVRKREVRSSILALILVT